MTAPDHTALISRLRNHATAEENAPFIFTSTGEVIPSVQAADMRLAADALEAAAAREAELKDNAVRREDLYKGEHPLYLKEFMRAEKLEARNARLEAVAGAAKLVVGIFGGNSDAGVALREALVALDAK